MSTVGEITKELLDLDTQKIREELNVQYHFVPINLKILTETLGDKIQFTTQEIKESIDMVNVKRLEAAKRGSTKDYEKLKKEIDTSVQYIFDVKDLQNKIAEFVEQSHKHKLIITSQGFMLDNGEPAGLKPPSPATVYLGAISRENIAGALYTDFEKTSKSTLFVKFLNGQVAKFLKDEIYSGKTENYTKGFDVGHILTDEDYAKTPLAEKLKRVVDTINQRLLDTVADSAYKTQALTRIRNIASGYLQGLKNRSSYGKLIEVNLHQDTISAVRGIRANIVFIQERTENQYWYGTRLEGGIGRTLIRLIRALGFSKSFDDIVEQQLAEAIKTGTVQTKGQRKTKRINIQGKRPGPNIRISPLDTIKTPRYGDSAPEIQGGGISSVTTLQNLLDANLVQTVKQNMGTGSRRDILNLRSGRFAESVRVERLSESRQGMITAFYSYMRNPYGTFSAGGRQSQPASRDPKLLISRSIREVAQQLQITRLRAVQV